MLQVLAFSVAVIVAAQDRPTQRVRSSEPGIVALVNAGLTQSETFRRLVKTLDESDVIVYIESQVTRESRQIQRESLEAYLIHHVVNQGGYRYLRIGLGTRGAEKRMIAVLAHELQHAVEIARAPEVRDDDSLQHFFSRVAASFACAGTCYETQEAKDIQRIVSDELAESKGAPAASHPRGMRSLPATQSK